MMDREVLDIPSPTLRTTRPVLSVRDSGQDSGLWNPGLLYLMVAKALATPQSAVGGYRVRQERH